MNHHHELTNHNPISDTSLLEAHILSRCRWAECEPVGGGAEVVDAGWLAPVLECRQSSRELSCINTACVCYTLSVRPKELACLFD
jgi:hypothetical protein